MKLQSCNRLRKRALGLELLEGRDLCAADVVSSNVTRGVLTINGTLYNDTVTVTQTATQVTVAATTNSGGVTKAYDISYPKSGLTTIVADMSWGNDRVVLESNVSIRSYLYGSWGNDYLQGGSNVDYLYGGIGDDTLIGGAGVDYLHGSFGSDSLTNDGQDKLFADNTNRTRAMSTIELEVVRLVNVERAKAGLNPVKASKVLAAAAWKHTVNMTKYGLSHSMPGTSTPSVDSRLAYAGYENWATWGENCAAGYNTAAEVVQGWMESTGHRTNILNPKVTELGVSMVADAKGVRYWTQNFGLRQ